MGLQREILRAGGLSEFVEVVDCGGIEGGECDFDLVDLEFWFMSKSQRG